MNNSTPIVIIGAGPTGLTMALDLTRHGVPVQIIEKLAAPIATSNALAMQARTLEMLDDMALIDEFLPQGLPLAGMSIYGDDKKLISLDLSKLETPYPYILGIPQNITERILTQQLEKAGIKVERNCELISIEQTAEQVSLQVNRDGKEETLTCAWLIACDGVHSIVRKQLALHFAGEELPQHFIMADVELEGDLPKNEANAFLSKDGPLAFIHLPQFSRVIIDVSNDSELKEVKTPALEHFIRLVKARCPFAVTLKNPLWTSGFWIHARLVDKYRAGRILLAGDAAHLHSPVGGQGMNTGMQDAYNLAWKLALVVQNTGKAELLDTYENERRPVAAAVIKESSWLTNIIALKNNVLKMLRNAVLPFIANRVQGHIQNAISELGVHYRKSDLSKQNVTAKDFTQLTMGDRMPHMMVNTAQGDISLIRRLRGKTFSLLLFMGNTVTESDSAAVTTIVELIQNKFKDNITAYLVAPEAIAQQTGWTGETILDANGTVQKQFCGNHAGLFLIRPDQYLAWCSDSLNVDPLQDYLKLIFV